MVIRYEFIIVVSTPFLDPYSLVYATSAALPPLQLSQPQARTANVGYATSTSSSDTSTNLKKDPQHAFVSNASAGSGAATSEYLLQKSAMSTSISSNSKQSGGGRGGSGEGQLNGLHITPSPSDSGIVDYEMLIRDKENELTSVRNAMEQNEGVLIRVYQDKERQFAAELQDIRQKLATSQLQETMLRTQLQKSDAIRQQLQKSILMLTEDRSSQQQKVR